MGEPSWAAQVAKAMKESMEQSRLLGSYSKRSIYKLPACVTALNPNSYNPQVVSFGPYHHGAARLKLMEEHKWRALHHFIDRASGESNRLGLEQLVSAISNVVQDLKDCYDLLDPKWHEVSESFVKLMILDGCFMLEILRVESEIITDYETDDPIFSDHGRLNIVPYIRRDMLILENQLPMLALEVLLQAESRQNKENNLVIHTLNNLILNFFYQSESRVPKRCLHALDVYRKSMIHEGPCRKTRLPRGVMGRDVEKSIIRSATELHEAGLKFKRSDSASLRDISFVRGVLRLPLLVVDDTTESMFLNFTAFERFHVGAGNHVIAYICFMESIIHSDRDVALLRSKGIIESTTGSNKEIAKLFNSLSRDVTADKDGNLMTVRRAVNYYRNMPRNAWRAHLAHLNHTYFRSPWASISFVAAIFLFVLTCTQTFFAVFPKK